MTFKDVEEIVVTLKGSDELVTLIFEDGEIIKQITANEYIVSIKMKSPSSEDEPIN